MGVPRLRSRREHHRARSRTRRAVRRRPWLRARLRGRSERRTPWRHHYAGFRDGLAVDRGLPLGGDCLGSRRLHAVAHAGHHRTPAGSREHTGCPKSSNLGATRARGARHPDRHRHHVAPTEQGRGARCIARAFRAPEQPSSGRTAGRNGGSRDRERYRRNALGSRGPRACHDHRGGEATLPSGWTRTYPHRPGEGLPSGLGEATARHHLQGRRSGNHRRLRPRARTGHQGHLIAVGRRRAIVRLLQSGRIPPRSSVSNPGPRRDSRCSTGIRHPRRQRRGASDCSACGHRARQRRSDHRGSRRRAHHPAAADVDISDVHRRGRGFSKVHGFGFGGGATRLRPAFRIAGVRGVLDLSPVCDRPGS
ncbi:unannotated protein [freshwater metagenome]|uniref:Unannotated protein n=1 Tax=freshwater metagenome TaxID=449393 RepID=A0A6J7MQY7_9ZZZZ